MPTEKTDIPGVLLFEPRIFEDARGYFFESYNQKVFEEGGITDTFVQDNQSRSQQGVMRGLHYQLEPHAQSKLVRVLEGEIFDVAVDIRKGSPHFGKWAGAKLSTENKKQLYVPRGFAHGFAVLSKVAVVLYKCDGFYAKPYERGIRYDDPDIGIDWPLTEDQVILSDKDRQLPPLAEAETNFIYQA